MMTNASQNTGNGSVLRPTLYVASLDLKTTSDEAKPKHVAQTLDYHDTHGWLISALLREMSGLEGKAMLECVESSFFPTNACDKEVVRHHDCGRKWPLRFWQMWKRDG